MTVLESTDSVSPRSAIRYRPSQSDITQRSVITSATHPAVRRASRPRPQAADDDLISEWQRADVAIDDDYEPRGALEPVAIQLPPKTDKPVRKRRTDSQTPVQSAPAQTVSKSTGIQTAVRPASAASTQPAKALAQRQLVAQPVESRTKPLPQGRPRRQPRPWLLLGLGMFLMLGLWLCLTAGINWWNDTMATIQYGYPRTFQIDAVVGHNDSIANPSHFLAINLHGRIEVIEFPGGDGSKARIFLGPQLLGSGADKTIVTLKFIDINGDHKPDMLIFFQGTWSVMINDQGTFRSPTDQEKLEASPYLSSNGQ